MGELAARLDSVVKWDRRGNVLLIDRFDEGLALGNPYGFGEGHAEFLSPDYPRQGGLGLCLYPGSDGDKRSGIVYGIPRPPYSKMGVEFCFGLNGDAAEWILELNWYTGAKKFVAAIRYDNVNDDIDYWSDAPGWAELDGDVELWAGPAPVHTLKLVVDYINQEYTRLIIDQQTWDMTGKGVQVVDPSFILPSFTVDIQVWCTVGEFQHHYIDNVIVTQNEP